MKKQTIINTIGIFFLTIAVVSITNTLVHRGNLAPILWMSYISMILLSIGALRKDSILILTQINILTIPYLLWTIDFIYGLINKETLFHITDYIFLPGQLLGKIISMQHLITIPLSFYLIYLIVLNDKTPFKSLKLSLFQATIVFFISRALTLPEKNVNCVFEKCINLDLGFYYPLQWFIAVFLMITITNYFITKLFKSNKVFDK